MQSSIPRRLLTSVILERSLRRDFSGRSGSMDVRSLVVVALCALPLYAAEADALAISANIQQRHLPFGGILDPIFAAPDSNQIIGYTRCGDSAIWTGHYLAAESFRYNVTRTADALANVRNAERALRA